MGLELCMESLHGNGLNCMEMAYCLFSVGILVLILLDDPAVYFWRMATEPVACLDES